MLRKLISLNLTIIMLITLVPLRVVAAESVQQENTQEASDAVEKLPTPTGLYWDGDTMKWAGMDTATEGQYSYYLTVLYSEADTTESDELSVVYHYSHTLIGTLVPTFDMAMLGRYGTGYYYFQVESHSADLEVILSSDKS